MTVMTIGSGRITRRRIRLHPQRALLPAAMLRLLCALVMLLPAPTRASAQDHTVVFEGRPLRRVVSSFEETVRSNLSTDEAVKYAVRIVERQGKYYWASREMRQLLRHEGGAYITFYAVDGAGYIRIGIPLMLDLRDQLPDEERRKEIGYVEHLLTQFTSITYYGNRLGAR